MIAPLTSSFTAINGPQAQLCTPPQSSAILPNQQNQGRRRAATTTTTRRRRNPTVAQYLGLGPSSVIYHHEQTVSASDDTRNRSASISKRRKLGNEHDAPCRDTKIGGQTPSVQTRVSDSLRVTKPRHSTVISSKVSPDESDSSSTAPEGLAAKASVISHKRTAKTISRCADRDAPTAKSPKVYVEEPVGNASSPSSLEDHPVTPSYANEVESEFDISDQLGHIASGGKSIFDDDDDDEEFNDDMNDDEFIELTCHVTDMRGDPANSPSSRCRSDSTHTIYVSEECPSPAAKLPASSEKDHGNSLRSSNKFVSPMTLTSRLLASTGDIDRADARKPIARSPFPEAVRDRSPIIGLSSDALLRTCFRVGEAINQAHQASKSGKHILFELYARIFESTRDEAKQNFTFCDLFHGKPPYIKGTYDGARWKSAQLFDYDSKRLLQQGRICRCLGTMKRDGKEWVMSVSSIWEATWDDIKWVEGIVNA